MREADHSRTVFAGDLGDPWVAAIAHSLPIETEHLPLTGDIPECWPHSCLDAQLLILHRPTLSVTDYERFRRQRRSGLFPRLVLCVGPHARYAHVQPWAELAEAIVSEATAGETLARHVVGTPADDDQPRPPVAVVSRNVEHGRWIAEASGQAGHTTVVIRDWRDVPSAHLAVWDVPVLEPGWPAALADLADRRDVIALLGLADRESVRLARAHGASACLEMPGDPADLQFVLGRVSRHQRQGAGARPSPARPARIRARLHGGLEPGTVLE